MTTHELLLAAKAAAPALAWLGSEEKNAAILRTADAIVRETDVILAANEADVQAAKGTISDVMLDRLRLTQARIAAMADGMRQVSALPDPVGEVLAEVRRPNGLVIRKTAVPLGVVAIIYESRPNVTSDAAVLAMKSGNVCVLRGGKEAYRSAAAIVAAMHEGLREAGLPETFVNLVSDPTRRSAQELMTASGLVDLLIPRGGAGLIRACVESATVPCIETGTGICHVYVDKDADLEKALNIIENAKTSRPSVCNADEVALVHRDVAGAFCRGSRRVSWTRGRRQARYRSSCGWTPRRRPSSPAHPRANGILTRNSSITSLQSRSSPTRTRPSGTSLRTPRTTPTPSSPKTRRRLNASPVWSTARRSTSTRRRASPTAASSASAARWAFPRRSSTPGARWACGS